MAKAKRKPVSKPDSKSRTPRRRPKFGDVFELKLSDGKLAYIQYVNEDRRPPPGFSGNGSLIRVLPAIHEKRPADPARLAEQEGEQFLIFFPIGVAVHRGLVEMVGHAEVPDRLQKLPRFKKFNEDRHTGKRLYYVMDPAKGLKFEQIGPKLPKEMLDDPLPYVSNLAALVNDIETGWTHRTCVRPEDIAD